MLPLLLAILILLAYFDPFLLLALWARKFYKPNAGGPLWRDAALWLSLTASTIAVIVFWGAVLRARQSHLGRHFHFGHYSRLSIAFAAVGFIAALFGFGKARPWAALAALIVPLNWWATLLLQ